MIEGDPYSHTEDAPPRWIRQPFGLESWLVTRYEDVRAVLSDPRFSKDPERASEALRQAGMYVSGDGGERSGVRSLLATDPPDHTRLRRLVTKAFTPRRVEELRPRIQEITDGLLDALAGADEADLVGAFAYPLPVTVICELMGVPVADRDDFRSSSDDLLILPLGPEERRRRDEAVAALRRYFAELVRQRRAEIRADLVDAQPDLISALLVARDEGGRLSEAELLSMLTVILVAGHETTVNLIGNSVLALLRHPEQLRLLRERPELLPQAIEEVLRWDGPVVQASLRVATEDVEVGGVVIPAGSVVSVGLAFADRDLRRFTEPDRFDITRTDNTHVAFGHGIHFCLGAPLARLEGEIAIGSLLDRFPDLALADGPPSWRPTVLQRGLAVLPVRLGQPIPSLPARA